jgi:uncharacterized protein HemX
MISTRKDQRGVGAVEAILILVIIAIIAGVGWYVWHVKQNSDKSLDQATTTSQNAGPRFKSDKTKSPSTPATQTKTDTTKTQ